MRQRQSAALHMNVQPDLMPRPTDFADGAHLSHENGHK